MVLINYNIISYNFNRVHCTYFRGYGCIVVKNTTATSWKLYSRYYKKCEPFFYNIFTDLFLLKDL